MPAAAREVEERVDDAGGSEGLPFDLPQQASPRILIGGFGQQHLGVTRDSRQGSVHLVGDAGGHRPERSQALLLGQLPLHRHPLGDVVSHDDPVAGRGALERRDGQLEVLLVPGGILESHLDRGVVQPRKQVERDQVAEASAGGLVAGQANESFEGAVRTWSGKT